MPTIRNLTAAELNLGRIDKTIGPHAELDISDSEAETLRDHRYIELVEKKPVKKTAAAAADVKEGD